MDLLRRLLNHDNLAFFPRFHVEFSSSSHHDRPVVAVDDALNEDHYVWSSLLYTSTIRLRGLERRAGHIFGPAHSDLLTVLFFMHHVEDVDAIFLSSSCDVLQYSISHPIFCSFVQFAPSTVCNTIPSDQCFTIVSTSGRWRERKSTASDHATTSLGNSISSIRGGIGSA